MAEKLTRAKIRKAVREVVGAREEDSTGTNIEVEYEADVEAAWKALRLIRKGVGLIDEEFQKAQAKLDQLRPAYLKACEALNAPHDEGIDRTSPHQHMVDMYEAVEKEMKHLQAERSHEDKDLWEQGDNIDIAGLDPESTRH